MENLNYKEIGKRIKIKRKEAKISQEKLSELADISISFMFKIEGGYSKPSLYTISKIATALNCSLDYLIFGNTITDTNKAFLEIVKNTPEERRDLFIRLCRNLSNYL